MTQIAVKQTTNKKRITDVTTTATSATAAPSKYAEAPRTEPTTPRVRKPTRFPRRESSDPTARRIFPTTDTKTTKTIRAAGPNDFRPVGVASNERTTIHPTKSVIAFAVDRHEPRTCGAAGATFSATNL